MSRFGLAVRLLLAEGPRSLAARLAERRAEARRWRRFRVGEGPLPGAAALTVLGTAPVARLGGVQSQLLTRLEAWERLGTPYALLVPSAPAGFRLYVWTPGAARRFDLVGSPGDAVSVAAVCRQALRLAAARRLHLEHPGELPPAAWGAVAAAAPATLVSLHDFALFCRRPHLLARPELRFCDFCRDDERCLACLASAGEKIGSPDVQRRHRAAGEALLLAADLALFPSPYLRARHLALFPALAPTSTRVLAPAIPPGPASLARRRQGEPLHVALADAARPHKGGAVAERLLAHREWRWTVFGGGDPAALSRLRRSGARLHGFYRRGELPALLARHRVDVLVVASVVPESFGLTLSEARRAGVPVVAFDHGAVGDRLREAGGGLLAPLAEGAEGLARRLGEMSADGGLHARLADEQRRAGGASAATQAGALVALQRSLA